MDLPVELVQLLQHAGIEGQKLTWDLQVNSTAVSALLPPGKETLYASASGRRKGTKPL